MEAIEEEEEDHVPAPPSVIVAELPAHRLEGPEIAPGIVFTDTEV